MTRFEELKELLRSNRSYRRFDESRKIDYSLLEAMVELTRYCASGRNLQPLRYRIVSTEEECRRVFPALKWAGYYQDWDGPEEGERPVAYLVQCLDTELTANCLCDDGLQLEAITLGASALGIHGTIIKAFNAEEVKNALALPDRYKPLYILSLGYPAETVLIEDTDGTTGADIRYHRDEEQRHIVPKRPLKELIIR
ncbi:MAG: nitroreductase family protein [Muribaculaceae bacterium]|nr:nitroreductase family protein [Muribaculaceae bacterium]